MRGNLSYVQMMGFFAALFAAIILAGAAIGIHTMHRTDLCTVYKASFQAESGEPLAMHHCGNPVDNGETECPFKETDVAIVGGKTYNFVSGTCKAIRNYSKPGETPD